MQMKLFVATKFFMLLYCQYGPIALQATENCIVRRKLCVIMVCLSKE